MKFGDLYPETDYFYIIQVADWHHFVRNTFIARTNSIIPFI